MRSPKTWGIIAVSVLALIAIGAVIFQRIQQGNQPATNVAPQTVHLTVPPNTTVDIYQSDEHILEGIAGDTESTGDPLITVEQSKDVQLAQGVYLVRTREQPDYTTFSQALIVSQQPVDFTVRHDYNEQKLQTLLAQETLAIRQAIITADSKIDQLYTIEPGQLYHQGDWYATKLIYKGGDTSQADTLRLVAQKQDGSWKLITTPPDITISSLRYPQIPTDILSDINNFK